MKKKLLALALLTGSSLFAGPRFAFGFSFGAPAYYPPPPPPVVAAVPPYPGPGYYWVNGYWFWNGPRRVWRPGYWAPRAYYGRPFVRGYGRR